VRADALSVAAAAAILVTSAACEKVDEPPPADAKPAAKPHGIVDLDAPIDPESLASAPPGGKVQNVPFITKHVTIHETVCDAAYQLSLYDRPPAEGERLDRVASERAVTLTFPRSARDEVLHLGKSDPRWSSPSKAERHLALAYGMPLPGQPDRVVRPEPGETALYLSITDWQERAEPDANGGMGRASGRISIRNSVNRGETGLWIEGRFDAVIVEGPGCLPD
jgi:hypothetical protein